MTGGTAPAAEFFWLGSLSQIYCIFSRLFGYQLPDQKRKMASNVNFILTV